MTAADTHLGPRPDSNKSMAGDSQTTVAAAQQPSVLDPKDGYDTTAPSELPSATPSVHSASKEKEAGVMETSEVTKEKEEVPADGEASSASEEDETDYPKAWKLAAITIALCLSVFCMALVRPIPPVPLQLSSHDLQY